MDYRILIYSEDAQLFLLLQHVLATEGFVSSPAGSVEDILTAVSKDRVGAVIVDGAAPRVDVRPLRADQPQVRVIFLSDRSPAPGACGDGLAEADLVLARPFDPTLLVQFLRRLRVEAMVAKGDAGPTNPLLRFADLEMDAASVKVRRNGHDVALTALQFRLLRQLLQNPRAVQSRDALIAACWSRNAEVEPRTVDIHMGHVRRALKKFGPDLIRTVRALGYALDSGHSSDR